MNKITAIGSLIRTGRGERGYAELTMMIRRKKGQEANIKFVLDTVLSPEIQLKDVIKVEGYIKGYQYMNEKGRWKQEQYFVATKVEPAEGEMKTVFGVKDHFSPEHSFKCYIEGKVSSVKAVNDYWKSILITLKGSKEVPDVINATVKDNIRLNEYKEIQKGDTIVARLSVWTPKKNVQGQIRTFEDLVIEDMFITNRTISQEIVNLGYRPTNSTLKKEPENINDFEETEE